MVSALPSPSPCPDGATPTTYTSPIGSGWVGVAGWTLVQWKPDTLRLAHGQEEAARVEPRLVDPLSQVVNGQRTLFGVCGEGGCVDPHPGGLVLPDLEGADMDVRAGMTAG